MNNPSVFSAAVAESDRDLFAGLAAGGGGAGRCRDELVIRYAPQAAAWARQYVGRGESAEDLRQIAYVGLLEALRRFDPDRGVEFVYFAKPTVLGLLRRHFRDSRRWVRIPRRLQELAQDIRVAQEELAARNSALPSDSDLAGHLHVTETDIGEARLGDQLFAPASLDAPAGLDTDGATLGDNIGADDDRIETMIGWRTVLPLVEQLPPRERDIVISTYWYEEPQASIGARWGVSQMQISRVLTRTLKELRAAA
jgi:RNA polymerase sigma-B factor